MEKNKILNADILDIIFDGKNKLYGAYELRRSYNKRLLKAVLCTAVLVFFAFLGTVFSSMTGKATEFIDATETTLAAVNEIKPVLPPPPPPPKPIQPAAPNQVKFVTLKIVPDEQAKDEKIEDIQPDQAISSQTIQSDITAQVQAPVEDNASSVVEAPRARNEDSIFIRVENEAQFPGGQAAWVRYLQKNLNPNVSVENGAPAGTYKVIIKFIVSKDGSISDINPITKFGFGMEEEAVKIIRSCPKWTPALQNGRYVNAYRSQPVTFVVDEP